MLFTSEMDDDVKRAESISGSEHRNTICTEGSRSGHRTKRTESWATGEAERLAEELRGYATAATDCRQGYADPQNPESEDKTEPVSLREISIAEADETRNTDRILKRQKLNVSCSESAGFGAHGVASADQLG
jgi:hypothetical protein